MKISKTLIATAFSVATIGATMAPMTVFAGGAETECICETKCDEDHINKDCEICSYDYTYCEGEEVKEEEHWGPLTPDGNMNLVDDYGSIEAGGKQFITVTTKAGNFFYIIIDRDDQGQETVHFLNLVDEADLLSLMDDEQVEEYIAATQEKEEEKEVVTIPDEPVPGAIDEPEPEPVVEEKKPNVGLLLLPVCVVVVGGIVIGTKIMKSKKEKEATKPDPDFDYDDDSMADFMDEDILDEELPEEDESDFTEDDSEDEE